MPLLRTMALTVVTVLILGLSAVSSSAETIPDVLPASYWQQQFDAQEAWLWSTASAQAQSEDSWQHYNLAYAVDAYGSMFEATGDARYLDKGLQLLEAVQRTAVPSSQIGVSQYRDGFLSWPGLTHPTNAAGEYPLYEFFMWRYGFRILRLAADAPVSPALKARSTSVFNFAEVNVWSKWWARGENSYIYRSVTHITAHAAFIGLSIEKLSANAERRAQARTVIDNFDSKGVPGPGNGLSMRDQLRNNPINPAAYFWNEGWGSSALPGSDVAHGGAVIAYISESHNMGGPWTQADMDRFALTLTVVVMPAAAYVDGSGSGTGWLADGWSRLGRHSLAAQKRLEVHGVQSQAQYMANMAVNAKTLLSAAAAAGPTPPTPPPPTTSTPPVPTPTPTVAPTAPASIQVSLTFQDAKVGSQAVISGVVTPARPGAPVALQQLSSGVWRTVGTALLTTASAFRFTPGIASRGKFTYRIQESATASASAITSADLVIVRR